MKVRYRKRIQLVAEAAVCLLTLLILAFGVGFLDWNSHPAAVRDDVPLRAGLDPNQRMTAYVDPTNMPRALAMYEELTGRTQWPTRLRAVERVDDFSGGRLSRWHWVKRRPRLDSGIQYHGDGQFMATEIKGALDLWFKQRGLTPVAVGRNHFRLRASSAGRSGTASGLTRDCGWRDPHDAGLKADN